MRTTLDCSCNLCLLNGSGRLELLRLHVESSLKEIFNTYLWLHSHWSTRSVKRVIWSVIISSVVEVICTSSREGHINVARFQANWWNSVKRREVCTCLAQLFRGEIKLCWPRKNPKISSTFESVLCLVRALHRNVDAMVLDLLNLPNSKWRNLPEFEERYSINFAL